MKKSPFILTAILALFTLTFTNAQTVEENHKKLSEHHATIQKKSGEITTTNKVKTTDEIGTNIEGAKKHHGEIMNKQTDKEKTACKDNHEAIKKHHANATKHQVSLKTEVEKPNSDVVKVKEHSTNISNEIKESEKHHSEIKKKTGKK